MNSVLWLLCLLLLPLYCRSMNVAYFMNGNIRTFTYLYPSLKQNLVDLPENEHHKIVLFGSTHRREVERFKTTSMFNSTLDILEEAFDKGNLGLLKEWSDEELANFNPKVRGKGGKMSRKARVRTSLQLSLRDVLDRITAYEQANDMTFDLYIRSRFDVGLLKPVVIDHLFAHSFISMADAMSIARELHHTVDYKHYFYSSNRSLTVLEEGGGEGESVGCGGEEEMSVGRRLGKKKKGKVKRSRRRMLVKHGKPNSKKASTTVNSSLPIGEREANLNGAYALPPLHDFSSVINAYTTFTKLHSPDPSYIQGFSYIHRDGNLNRSVTDLNQLKGVRLQVARLLGKHIQDVTPFSNTKNVGNRVKKINKRPLDEVTLVTRQWIEEAMLGRSLDGLYVPLTPREVDNTTVHDTMHFEVPLNMSAGKSSAYFLHRFQQTSPHDLFIPMMRFHYCSSFAFLGYDHIRFATEKEYFLEETEPSFYRLGGDGALEATLVLNYELTSIPSMFLRNMFTYMLVREPELLFDFYAGFVHEKSIVQYEHYGGIFRCLPTDFKWEVETPPYFDAIAACEQVLEKENHHHCQKYEAHFQSNGTDFQTNATDFQTNTTTLDPPPHLPHNLTTV